MIDVFRLNSAIAAGQQFVGLSKHPAMRGVLETIDLLHKAPPVVPLMAFAKPRPAPIVVNVDLHLHLDGDDGVTGE